MDERQDQKEEEEKEEWEKQEEEEEEERVMAIKTRLERQFGIPKLHYFQLAKDATTTRTTIGSTKRRNRKEWVEEEEIAGKKMKRTNRSRSM